MSPDPIPPVAVTSAEADVTYCPLTGKECLGEEQCAPALLANRAGIAPLMCPIVMFMSMASLVAATHFGGAEEEEDDPEQDWPCGIKPDQVDG